MRSRDVLIVEIDDWNFVMQRELWGRAIKRTRSSSGPAAIANCYFLLEIISALVHAFSIWF